MALRDAGFPGRAASASTFRLRESSFPEDHLHMIVPLPPLVLILEFARAKDADDPYSFQFVPQDYLLRTSGGGFERALLSWDTALLADLESVRQPISDPVVRQRLGETLRRFLTPLGWADMSAQILEAARQGRRVHLTVRSAAAELYALPWELLVLKASGQHVGELQEVLLRYEWPETVTVPEYPTPRQGSGRIVLAWSAAGGAVPAAEHAHAIAAACRKSSVEFNSAQDILEHASLARLTKALAAARRDNRPVSILHLLAHGGATGSTFGLMLDGEAVGDGAVVVDAGRLRQMLAPYADMVRLVVLMACDSGNTGALANQLGSVAQTLHRAGVAAVVASRYPLSVASSVRLAESLYAGLLGGPDSLESALLMARTTLAADTAHKDWASLQLYARAGDGDDSRPIVFRPYQGLSSFQLEQRRFFFGRQALIEKLWRRSRELFAPSSAARLLAILGPSGSGKSSVARAGLVTALLQNPLPDFEPLRVATLRPGEHPHKELQRALGELQTVRPEPPLLLLVDQFEEVYTLCSDTEERDSFVAWLLRAVGDPARRIAVVLTLRSDFFGETQRHHSELNQLIAAQHELVPGLTATEMRQIIAEPARIAGHPLDPDTVELLLNEARGNESALPLVEFALTRIWEGVLAGKEPGSTLREIGGIGGALADQAKKLYSALRLRELTTARRALTRLVKLGEGTRDTRRRAPVSELCGRGESEADVLAVLRQFASEHARIITLSSSGSETLAEVTHEALFDHWLELRSWIDEGRADRRFHDRLAEAARLWNEDRSRSGRLWRPPDLDLLRVFRARNPEDLSALDEEFFTASEKEHQAELEEKQQRTRLLQQRARLLRSGLAAVSGLLIAAIGFAGYAVKEQRDATRARDRAEQSELDARVEAGRLLLIDKERPIEALLRLRQLKVRGSRAASLPYLIHEAARTLDAVPLVLSGHTGTIRSAAYSPDGTRIITGSDDKTARIWDARTGQLLLTLSGHTNRIFSASFSPDGRRVVTGSADNAALIWDAETGQLLATLSGHTDIARSASFSRDGSRIVTSSEDKTARVWDATTGQLLITLQDPAVPEFDSASFSPDGSRIVSSNWAETARIWDAHSGQLIFTLKGHADRINSVSYSPDGSRIVTGSADKTVRIWDAHGGQLIDTLSGPQDQVTTASYSPDGGQIVAGSLDQAAWIWDAHGGQLLAVLRGHSSGVIGTSYSPDGNFIVTGSADQTARVWDARFGQALMTLKGHADSIRVASCSPDGSRVVTAGKDKIARIWDAQSGRPLATLSGHTDGVTTSSYSPDGTRIVTGSEDKTARIWDAKSGQLLNILEGHSDGVTAASFSPDGRRIVTASAADVTARIWDAQSGRPLITLHGNSSGVTSARYSPDGSRVVAASEDKLARIWDAKSGELLLTLQGHWERVSSASFSPDGSCVVTASDDGTARVWDAKSGLLLTILQGHHGRVTQASHSPDGRRIVTSSTDGIVRVWDARSGQPIAILRGHGDIVTSAGYTPDGNRIVTSSADKTARIWDAAPDARSTAELQSLLDCRAAQKLAGDEILPAPIDQQACQQLPPRAPLPATWDQQTVPLWAGIYALRAGNPLSAKVALAEARRRIEHFSDPENLAKLTLVEAALSAPPQAPPPASVAALVGRREPNEQVRVWRTLAKQAAHSLHRLTWSLWAFDELQKVVPSDPSLVATARAEALEVRLDAGLAEEVLQQASSVLAAQTEPRRSVAVAAMAWAAALQKAPRNERQDWARRTADLYFALPDRTDISWAFESTRHALLNQPDSADRAAALALFALLEQVKSADTVEALAKLLKIRPPKRQTKPH